MICLSYTAQLPVLMGENAAQPFMNQSSTFSFDISYLAITKIFEPNT